MLVRIGSHLVMNMEQHVHACGIRVCTCACVVAVSAPGVWHVSGETCLVVTDLEGKPLHWWKLNKNARTVVSD